MQTVNKAISVKECLLVLLCLSVGMMSGCSSSGVKRADKTVASAETLKGEYLNLKSQIDSIQGDLDRLVASKDSDLRSAFDAYQAGLKKLDSQAKKVMSRSADLRKNSSQYLNQWEKQMQTVQNPALQAKAAERRAQASAQFEQARDELERIQGDYNNFVANLKDIKVALENDLNPAGVMAIQDEIIQVRKNAGPVKEDIDTIIAALEKISAALSTM